MPATHAQLAPETCTSVGQSGTSFFSGTSFLHTISTETVRHVTRTVQRDWPESCFGARNCDELASNILCKFLVQVSWACVASITVWLKVEWKKDRFLTISRWLLHRQWFTSTGDSRRQ